MHYIDVILPIPIPKLFTYSISEAEVGFLKPGMRVSVPFGKAKIYTALVFNIHTSEPHAYEAKEIHQILDDKPIITQKQLEHWQWISEYYMCTLGDVMRAALPSAFILESETIITSNKEGSFDASNLKDDEYLIYEALLLQSSLKIHDIVSILDKKNILPVIKRLLDKNVISVDEEIFEKYKPKLVRYVKLQSHFSSHQGLQDLLEELSRAPKQREVIMSLFSLSAQTKKPIKVSDLTEKSQASSATIKALIDKDVLEEYYIQMDRIQYSGEENNPIKQLSEAQNVAFQEIKASFKTHNITLLHGVTSSGKTEIYVKLIEAVLAQDKQVLYLLPEIALTTQLVNRLQDYFGEKVAVFHSKYSSQERVEVWNQVLNKSSKAQIILGARSSILLPFQDLGLVIV
ncbi:MAG: DEAD/DEAH box helicase, partial [Xanthomarina sp.]